MQPSYYADTHPATEYRDHAHYPPSPIPFPALASTPASTSRATGVSTGARYLGPEKAAYRRGDLSLSSGSTNPSASVATTDRVPESPGDPPAYE